MKKSFVFLSAFLAFAFSGLHAFAGDKYVGKWGGQVGTSIEITSKTRVIYCYDGNCNTLKVKGKPDAMTFTFPKNGDFPGAEMTMTKDGDNYLGEYAVNGSSEVAQATLVKE